jgi:hypothetical protein
MWLRVFSDFMVAIPNGGRGWDNSGHLKAFSTSITRFFPPRKQMEQLISELARLYLPRGTAPDVLAQRLLGQATGSINLLTSDGLARAMVIPFRKTGDSGEGQHWSRLCEVANALQAQLGLPAPAVSISGADGYGLWLSLESAVPAAQAQEFLELLHRAYIPDLELAPDAASTPAELPPCLDERTGKWAAFIHPGMGSSFAEESGLEMAPPFAGQAALLEALQSISGSQFTHVLNTLQQSHGAAPGAGMPSAKPAVAADGLLLEDATLEDIVRHLHSKNIEPTFRHLMPSGA